MNQLLEATGVIQAVGAIGRMAAPQLFIRLWLRAVAQKGQRGALPLGAPMLSVSAIALLQAWHKRWNWVEYLLMLPSVQRFLSIDSEYAVSFQAIPCTTFLVWACFAYPLSRSTDLCEEILYRCSLLVRSPWWISLSRCKWRRLGAWCFQGETASLHCMDSFRIDLLFSCWPPFWPGGIGSRT